MRPENITGLVCLSFTLLFLCVNSQSCNSGWFGPGCKYKCRCVNDQCDVSGSCTAPSTCQGGYFGPACQYADLAYLRATPPDFTDGNDKTCNTATSITIPLGNPHFFTWMRFLIRGQASDAIDKVGVTFFAKTTRVNCADPRRHVVDDRTVDLHCNLMEEIDEVALNIQAMTGFCSVFVSGGRNVALKANASQDSTYVEEVKGTKVNFTADLAVDGGTNQRLTDLSCSHTNHTHRWTLRFSMPRRVHRYVIYNRLDNGGYILKGFRLQSFDSGNGSVFEHNEPYDPNGVASNIYRLTHKPASIEKIEITSYKNWSYLNLCEVEVYGDSDCDRDHYGRDCELSCNCPYWEPCFPSCGNCPSGCPIGFHGLGCMIGCDVGTFGEFCNLSCSDKCDSPANTTYCNVSTGACLLGCKSGFGGEFCQDVCPHGKFGAHCNLSCSQNCMPTGVNDVSTCDPVNLSCRNGCKDGFTGSPCLEECPIGKYGANCSSSCSQNCMPTYVNDESPCDPVTGVCRKGCKDGFIGSHCLEECPVGKYGANCNSSCSPNCLPTGVKDVSPCDHVDGNCSKGCKEGFTGSHCLEPVATHKSAAAAATSDLDILPIIVGLCLLFAALACLGFFFCKKRKAPTSAEREAASVHPDLLK